MAGAIGNPVVFVRSASIHLHESCACDDILIHRQGKKQQENMKKTIKITKKPCVNIIIMLFILIQLLQRKKIEKNNDVVVYLY